MIAGPLDECRHCVFGVDVVATASFNRPGVTVFCLHCEGTSFVRGTLAHLMIRVLQIAGAYVQHVRMIHEDPWPGRFRFVLGGTASDCMLAVKAIKDAWVWPVPAMLEVEPADAATPRRCECGCASTYGVATSLHADYCPMWRRN